MNETELLTLFIAECAGALPHLRVFRRTIVNAAVQRGGRTFQARAGIKGQADAYAIIEGGGHVEIETKAARGAMRTEQVAWRDHMLRMRVPHLVLRAHAGEHPASTVERWIAELRAVAS